jgi:predicted HicB family RNase H-like nuclease
MPNTGNKVQVISLVDPKLAEALTAEAKRQDISLSHLIRRILTAYDNGEFKLVKPPKPI